MSRWRVAYPEDGIPESRREEFEVTLDDADAARSIIIRVRSGRGGSLRSLPLTGASPLG